MSETSVEVRGTVRPDGTLELNEKLNVSAGPVRVRVERLVPADQPVEGLVEFVERVRRAAAAAGSRFMNDEEVAAWIEELRADDDRIEEAYRRAEEERRREGRGC